MTPTQAQLLSLASVLGVFAFLEWRLGRFSPPQATREDHRLDVAVIVMFLMVTAAVALTANLLASLWLPEWRGALADWPWWAMLLTLIIGDDLTQYGWHRLSHSSVLWPLHRAHHSAPYMSVRVVYRNNALYYALMPGLWIMGLLVYLGFGWVTVGYTLVKIAVIVGAHSAWRWDEALYQKPALRPLMWLLERLISTPATHHAHHALTETDGIGHYSGNFGNLFFLWDVIFGTAVITRRYPPAVGLQDDLDFGPERWQTQLFYPLVRSSRAQTVLGRLPGLPPASTKVERPVSK
ncbi:MAG: sterol desaturase family protein [Proteobacteria bacterium]|nr:sterol desaturase family protein [Pseudomonadota bacterium]